jgi:BlaI family penicillinase repressor
MAMTQSPKMPSQKIRPEKMPKLSALELHIMNELWTRGALSIREVHEAVVKKERPAYTTVQTMVYRLEAKGALRRTRKIGNAHVFEATTTRASVQTRLLKELLGLFGGSARPVMAHLVEMGKISKEDIDDAQKLLREHSARADKDADK